MLEKCCLLQYLATFSQILFKHKNEKLNIFAIYNPFLYVPLKNGF